MHYCTAMISRTLEDKIKSLAKQLPAIALMGPLQSGKTTLARHLFGEIPYVSLEDIDVRSYAERDPRRFLSEYKDGAIFDEIQNVPHLFSYLQRQIDDSEQNGRYILTGSQNFLLHQSISQSLAGRVAMVTLLPLSMEELNRCNAMQDNKYAMILKGFYPRIHKENIEHSDWYPSYITTYLERYLRQLKNISSLSQFQLFLKLCSGRIGQLLNYASLANDCGISLNTAKSWIGLLESSYIIFLLRPHHANFNKRLVKSPKLYFFDTGVAASLLEIETERQLFLHPLRGALFENLVILEAYKYRINQNKKPNLFFWRDNHGNEVDLIIESAIQKIPVEIKSGETVSGDFFKGVNYWRALAGNVVGYAIYGGQRAESFGDNSKIIPWQQMHSAFHNY